MSPCWATLLWYWPRLEDRRWYWLGSIPILIASVWLAYNPVKVYGISLWLHWYGLYGLVYLVLFGARLGYTAFNRALALTIMALFIAADIWELPAIINDYIFKKNGVADAAWYASQVRRVYTLAVYFLFAKLTGFKWNRRNGALMLLGLAAMFALFFYDHELIELQIRDNLGRTIFLPVFGVIAYLGMKDAV